MAIYEYIFAYETCSSKYMWDLAFYWHVEHTCMSGQFSVVNYNATFNNILVISWRLILLVEETGVPGEN
jgi:hypothetical protein